MPRATFSQIANRSMSEVIVRSLVTSVSTLFPVLALMLFGGETLHGLRLRAARRHRVGRVLVDLHRDAGADALEGARAGLPAAHAGGAPGARRRRSRRTPTARWRPSSTPTPRRPAPSREPRRARAGAPRRARPAAAARGRPTAAPARERAVAGRATRHDAPRRPTTAGPAAGAATPAEAPRARPTAPAPSRPSAPTAAEHVDDPPTDDKARQGQPRAQEEARSPMSMLVWVMMGIAIWHFTVWVPDHFWGGIVGAFLAAHRRRRRCSASSCHGFTVPGQNDTDIVQALDRDPGRADRPRRCAAGTAAQRAEAAEPPTRPARPRAADARLARPGSCASARPAASPGAPPAAAPFRPPRPARWVGCPSPTHAGAASPTPYAAADAIARELGLSPSPRRSSCGAAAPSPDDARRFLAADERHDPFAFDGHGRRRATLVLDHVAARVADPRPRRLRRRRRGVDRDPRARAARAGRRPALAPAQPLRGGLRPARARRSSGWPPTASAC